MPRRSKIKTLPPDVRAYIERLLREDRLTLDEMMAEIRAKFPGQDAPSRSGLGRYAQTFAELTSKMREMDTVARAVVEELGESPDDRAGALLTQAITTLATGVALDAQTREVTVEEVRKLARAAKDTIDARTKSLKERQAIERIAREQAAEEAAKEARDGGVSEATIARIRERVLRGGG